MNRFEKLKNLYIRKCEEEIEELKSNGANIEEVNLEIKNLDSFREKPFIIFRFFNLKRNVHLDGGLVRLRNLLLVPSVYSLDGTSVYNFIGKQLCDHDSAHLKYLVTNHPKNDLIRFSVYRFRYKYLEDPMYSEDDFAKDVADDISTLYLLDIDIKEIKSNQYFKTYISLGEKLTVGGGL